MLKEISTGGLLCGLVLILLDNGLLAVYYVDTRLEAETLEVGGLVGIEDELAIHIVDAKLEELVTEDRLDTVDVLGHDAEVCIGALRSSEVGAEWTNGERTGGEVELIAGEDVEVVLLVRLEGDCSAYVAVVAPTIDLLGANLAVVLVGLDGDELAVLLSAGGEGDL